MFSAIFGLFSLVSGYKTYASVALGLATVLANHFGYNIPGVVLDPSNWIADLFGLGVVAFGRHAISKR